MQKLKIAVIGAGRLGSIHARIYKELEDCSLVGICDTNKHQLNEISKNLNTCGYPDYKQLFDKVDAVSIAVPTNLHYKISSDFLKHKRHVLVEKPFTTTLKQADSLIKLARKNKLILQVGHIERFNSAFSAALSHIKAPKFIECHRLSPFPNRSIDIGVVLDLMIHDIDIVLGLLNSRVKKIESVGVPVLTGFEDIANARLTFKNGCVANLTASRVSDEAMRKIRIFQENTYISLNYKEAKASVYKKTDSGIAKENLPIESEEPLIKELKAFIESCIRKKEPLVSGEVAREALAIALKISRQICRKKIS
ncbi:MAG: Gfo/Idh/MocA family oxidoreductase [Candidatus Omnitrophota bacterium]|nr:Gfo/Idh/MocA family oxidoreductase [Candidatus Omnitrophota bacterium]